VTPAPSILVADDDPTIRRVLARVVQRARPDATIVEAADGSHAIAAVHRQPLDLVITDYHMPHASGLDVVAAVRAHSPRLPVVIVSAHPHIEPAAMTAGATAFVTKPFSIEQLTALIRSLLP
jgi:DNA-binding NtrC family response regulator